MVLLTLTASDSNRMVCSMPILAAVASMLWLAPIYENTHLCCFNSSMIFLIPLPVNFREAFSWPSVKIVTKTS